jgi:TetR/AcrR family transcriptional repressor of nem operon
MSKSERTRQSIIEQAAVIFNEKGIAGTSIDDVLKAAKVAKGCLYGHFESKDELSYASVDFLMHKLVEKRDSLLGKQITAKGKVFAFLESNKNPLKSFIDGGCPIANLSTETDDTNPVIKQKLKTVVEQAIKLFTGILKDGISSGELSDKLEPEDYAVKMFMSIEGANSLCRVLGSVKPMQTVIKSLKNELEGYVLVPVLQ